MEERTIIKQGGGGYTIYLPKKWIDAKGLKEKDSIFIDERNGVLILHSKEKPKEQGLILLDESNKHDVRTLLTHFYREGFDQIKITGVDSSAFTKIRSTVKQHLLGFEVIEKENDVCIVGNISEPTEKKYDMILKRIFLVTYETIAMLCEDGREGKFNHMDEIQDLRDQLDKFVLFCRRIVIKEQIEHNETLSWEMLTFLNHIQHAAYYLYKYVSEKNCKLSEGTVDFLCEAKSQFQLYREAYYNKDLGAVHEINKRKVAYQTGACIRALEKSKSKETVALSYARELLRLIQIGTSPIISIILENQYNKSP